MNGDNKFWLGFWIIIVSGIVAFGVVIACYYYNVNRVAFENGYERVQLNGSRATAWQKVR